MARRDTTPIAQHLKYHYTEHKESSENTHNKEDDHDGEADHDGNHSANTHTIIGITLMAGFLMMFCIEELGSTGQDLPANNAIVGWLLTLSYNKRVYHSRY